jgi:hypothetical protein
MSLAGGGRRGTLSTMMSSPNTSEGAASPRPTGERNEPGASGGGVVRGVLEHWQVLGALALLLVGAVGLWADDGTRRCEVVLGTEPIPDDLQDDVEAAAEESGFPVSVLAAQLEAESSWDPEAHSRAGAMGIAQFTQDTWDIWGAGDPLDEKDAIAAQGRYMGFLREELEPLADSEDELTRYALAGYNAGPNAVTDADGIPPYAETQQYVERIQELAASKYTTSCR